MHFWNPPHLIPLVEIVPGKHTSQETSDIAFQLVQKIGKEPVLLNKEAPGFIGNRLQLALLREAYHIVAEGIATPEAVDTVIEFGPGRRWAKTGPFKSLDLGGKDVFQEIFKNVAPHLSNSPGIPERLTQAVEAGKLGTKTGEGVYLWSDEALASVKNKRGNELIRHLKDDRSGTAPARPAAPRPGDVSTEPTND